MMGRQDLPHVSVVSVCLRVRVRAKKQGEPHLDPIEPIFVGLLLIMIFCLYIYVLTRVGYLE